jgi:hypothetical protein
VSFDSGLPAVRIRPDRKMRIGGGHIELSQFDANAGIERHDTGLIGKERIDVELF